ncbi:hypothetical protein HMPREF1986_00824 [Oribacterium sp. oral taxon 078 str. F0263]|nr:hypothetical protein HMPREF1986_00824 [Oribacterium sp. oral taxon 078 str. F0263]
MLPPFAIALPRASIAGSIPKSTVSPKLRMPFFPAFPFLLSLFLFRQHFDN